MESDQSEAFSSSDVCAQMRQALSSLKWACHEGTDVERRRGAGTPEGESFCCCCCWHLSNMKATLSLLPFEVKVILFLQLVTEHFVL